MTRKNDSDVRVGDWVESYSPGVWQVVCILDDFIELRFRPEAPNRRSRRRLVFCKRFVDERWKKAFKAEVAEAALVHPLSEDQRTQLDNYIAEYPRTLGEFEGFCPEMPDHIFSLRLNLPQPVDVEKINQSVMNTFTGIESGFTNEEVLDRLGSSHLGGYLSEGISNLTIRFLCRRHEIRDGQFVFRAVDVQPF